MDTVILMSVYLLELVKIYVVNILLFDEKEVEKRQIVYLSVVSLITFCISMVTLHSLSAYLMGLLGGWFITAGRGLNKLRKYVSLVPVVMCMDIIPEIFLEKIGMGHRWADVIVSLISLGIFGILLSMKNYLPAKLYKIKLMQITMAVLCISLGFGVAVIQDWFSYLPDKIGMLNYDLILLLTFVSVILLIFLMVYMERMNYELRKTADIEKELRLLQKKNSALLLKKGEETRKYRHDMNHHISCLYQIAQKEEAGQTMQYLEKIQNNLLAIRNMNYETGLEVLDILLNVLLADLSHVKITVEGKCYRETVLDEVESCVVFSNLLQNAIDELQRQKKGKKKLLVRVKEGRLYSNIMIVNTVSEEVRNHTLQLETRKEDKENHGYGLKNVRNILEKKDGRLSLELEGEEFIAEVTVRNQAS